MIANNRTLRTATLAALFLAAVGVPAQKRIGDFIESRSYNDDKRGTERSLQYRPDGRDFVSINGKNEYTRALYGGYRLSHRDKRPTHIRHIQEAQLPQCAFPRHL